MNKYNLAKFTPSNKNHIDRKAEIFRDLLAKYVDVKIGQDEARDLVAKMLGHAHYVDVLTRLEDVKERGKVCHEMMPFEFNPDDDPLTLLDAVAKVGDELVKASTLIQKERAKFQNNVLRMHASELRIPMDSVESIVRSSLLSRSFDICPYTDFDAFFSPDNFRKISGRSGSHWLSMQAASRKDVGGKTTANIYIRMRPEIINKQAVYKLEVANMDGDRGSIRAWKIRQKYGHGDFSPKEGNDFLASTLINQEMFKDIVTQLERKAVAIKYPLVRFELLALESARFEELLKERRYSPSQDGRCLEKYVLPPSESQQPDEGELIWSKLGKGFSALTIFLTVVESAIRIYSELQPILSGTI